MLYLVLLDIIPFYMDPLKAFRPVFTLLFGFLGCLSNLLFIESDLATVIQVFLLTSGDGILEYPHLPQISVILDPQRDGHWTGEVPPHGARTSKTERVEVLIQQEGVSLGSRERD